MIERLYNLTLVVSVLCFIVALFTLGSVAANGQGVVQRVPTTMFCMPAEAMKASLEKLGEKIVGGGVVSADKQVGLFVREKDNDWSVVLFIRDQGIACAIAGGKNWLSKEVGKPKGQPL